MMHKFIKNTTKKKLVIPTAVMELSGFEKGAPVEIRAATDAVIVLKKEMTAMELLHAVDQLHETAVELLTHIAGLCDPCENCGEAADSACPYLANHTGTEIPPDVRMEAGIPEDAKLCAWADPDRGVVTVIQADYRHDLSDVPGWEMEVLAGLGVCLEDLDELLMEGDVVYD